VAARRLRLDRTLGPGVVAWIEANLVHGPGDVQGQPIELDDEQVRFILHAYELDDRGKRVVRRAVFSRAKGRAKSELAAMLACAEGLGPVRFNGWGHDGKPLGRPVRGPVIPCIATEEGQAGNVYRAIEFMLRYGQVAGTSGLDVGLTRTFLPGGGVIQPVTAKAHSKEGGWESFAVFDETHLYVLPELHRLHDTIRRNLSKRKEAEPWSLEVSTMYAPGEGSVAEHSHAYAKALEEGKIRDPGFLFDHRAGPEEFDFDDDEQLRAALVEAYGEAAGWMDIERLIAEARDPQTDESDFRRYFVNRATRREAGLFIRSSTWAALGPTEPLPMDTLIPEGAEVCLGADGSRTFDTTVVAWAHETDDREAVEVDCCVFSVRKDAPHHILHEGGKIDFDDVEGFLIDRFDLFQVLEVAYDPRYLERSAELVDRRLPEGMIFPVEPSSRHMRDALQTFYRVVEEGKMRHRGDPVIAAHLANTKVERGPRGEIRRVGKIDERKPIDAVPAMALAVWRAVQADTSVYEEHEILVV
jgi:phage terminase large subunit-like protein